MKIIEAMKSLKENKEKIAELQVRINQNSAHMSVETPVYENITEKINGWVQSCEDLTQENIKRLTDIARTNLATSVTIELGDKQVTKTIAEWVWRRREYAAVDKKTQSMLTDRGLKDSQIQSEAGGITHVNVVRNYDPEKRDDKLDMYRSEPHRIDAALEVINAVTDLVE